MVTPDPACHELLRRMIRAPTARVGDYDSHIPTTGRPGRPVAASYDEEVSPACSTVRRAVAVVGGPVFALAAAIIRAAEGALVSWGIRGPSDPR